MFLTRDTVLPIPAKSGVNGKKEKDVNLSIAKKVEKKLKKQNIAVKMTRREDKGLDNTKIGDMKARVNMINGTKPTLAVSIHQNSYTQEEIKGAQVFYFTHSKDGKEAAEVMQEMFRLFDKENKRVCKGNNTYYMLKKTEVPTIIVECGFLSNWEEAKKLSTKEYQGKSSTGYMRRYYTYFTKTRGIGTVGFFFGVIMV